MVTAATLARRARNGRLAAGKRAAVGSTLAVALLVVAPPPAQAFDFDQTDLTITTYEVDGSDLTEIEQSMTENGPRGFWAYTTWNVTWTGNCELSVVAEIIVPELAEDADLYDEEVAEFDRMSEALLSHELEHVANGVAAADEVESQGCPADTTDIFARYNQADIDFDAETEHGFTEGVYLEKE